MFAARCTGTAGIEGEKGKKNGLEENATFSIQLFLARCLHCIIIGYFLVAVLLVAIHMKEHF